MMEKWRLPEGWKWVALGEICEMKGGGTPRRDRADFFGSEIVWITPSDIQTHNEIPIVFDSKTKLTERGLNSSSARLLPKGTVLFSSRATIGKIAIAGVPLATNQGFANLICSPRVLNTYVAWTLKAFTEQIKKIASSTTYLEISKRKLKTFAIPLPYPDDPARSLAEQQRVVARIEALLAEVRAARALHEEIGRDTGRLMDAVLAEVFEAIESIFPTVTLSKLTTKIGSGSTPRGGKAVYKKSGIPFVRSLNVRWGEFSPKDLAFIDYDTHTKMKSTEVKSDDVLLNITGASIGRACCIPKEYCPANVNQHVSIIRPTDELNPRYLMYWLISPPTQNFIMANQSGATRQALTKRQIQQFQVPLPDKNTQSQLISYLDHIATEIAEMKQTQKDEKKLLDEMEQAILAQAFRGEL